MADSHTLTPFRKSQMLLNWTHNIQLTHRHMHQSWYNRVIMYKMTSFLCICGPDCVRKYERKAPQQHKSIITGDSAAFLSPLSFRCSHGRRFTPPLSSRLSLTTKRQTVDKPCLERQGYVPNTVFLIAEFLKRWYRIGGIMWTSTLATAITTPKETDHNNTHNNNNCNKACVFKGEDAGRYRCSPHAPPPGGC